MEVDGLVLLRFNQDHGDQFGWSKITGTPGQLSLVESPLFHFFHVYDKDNARIGEDSDYITDSGQREMEFQGDMLDQRASFQVNKIPPLDLNHDSSVV